MKTILLLTALLLGTAINSVAQEKGDWSFGLGLSPYWDGLSASIYANRHMGDRWQVGLMPFTRYYTYTGNFATTNQYYLGANLNARYYVLKEKKLLPYRYGFGGYAQTYTNTDDGSTISKERQNNYDFSLGLGTQYQLGNKGWSLDLNIGYLWFNEINGADKFRAPFYSFGVFKRLIKSQK